MAESRSFFISSFLPSENAFVFIEKNAKDKIATTQIFFISFPPFLIVVVKETEVSLKHILYILSKKFDKIFLPYLYYALYLTHKYIIPKQ